MIILPAIDLFGGQAVRLYQGDYNQMTVYDADPLHTVAQFEAAGARLNVAYVCNRPRQVIDIVSNNTGLAARTIADEITERDLEKVKVLELKNDPFLLPVNLIARKDRHFSMHERLFRHMIIDSYR